MTQLPKRSDIVWLFRSTRGVRAKAVLNIVLGTLRVALDMVFIWSCKACIDVATGKSSLPFRWVVVSLVVTTLLTLILGFGGNWVGAVLGTQSQNIMRLKTFSRLMSNVWSGRDTMHTGDTMNRLMSDASTVTSIVTDSLPALVCTLLRLGCAFVFLYQMQPMLAIVIICIVPFFLLASSFYVRRMRRLSKEIRETDSQLQVALQENLQNKTVIQTLGRTESSVQTVAEIQDLQLSKVINRTRFSSVASLVTSAGFATGYLVTFVWGVEGLRAGTLTYGMMMAFVQLVGQIQEPFRSLIYLIPQLISAMVSVDRIREMEQTPVEESGNQVIMRGCPGLRFDDVTFRYDDGDRAVIEHFSHDFRPGSFTAVLGETGAGKTTLLRLILALTHPTEGRAVIYDSERETEISVATRCNITYVPQGNTLLSGTVRDNLLLGNPQATESDMRNTLAAVCADFVLSHPQGVDMKIGEGGLGLSEGQAQRICIARSLLKGGRIILMDEATSALDIHTEHTVIANIKQRAEANRQTIIFVTHRQKVLEYCDEIVRIE